MRLLPLLALLPIAIALISLSGCVSVRPFTQIRREVPADQFLSIHGRLVHVEQAGTGEPVVLLHGFGASTYAWRKVMPELATRFRVIAIDLNGFGYTERPSDLASYTREGQGRLVLDVMDALGIGRAHIVGHSYGGGITLWLAAYHPERFLSMVLTDSSAPTYSYDRRSRVASVKPLTALFLRSVVLRPSTVRRSLLNSFHDPSLVTPELVQAYFDRIRVEGAIDAYYGLTVPVRGPIDKVDLAKIEVPALVVWGADDQVILLPAGRRGTSVLPRGRFVVIPDSGHIPIEEKPAEWLRLVMPFLTGAGK
ncbi:MAG TPA: alpha/beta hydrolase [Thermoanaerobaculia bacterium]|jgi:pimeloyl-ACP methyl ester carboxylesterase|nr:alpha/beta hydrolase [Thermoanaerobaculia bacterium]